MGYSVDVLLERADQRATFDEAVRAGGYDLACADEGDKSWDDYEKLSLWDGYSAYRDFFEALRRHGSRVKLEEVCPEGGDEKKYEWECKLSYWLEPRVLVALGEVARSVYASPMGEAVRVAETLSHASEYMAEEFWSEALRPRTSVKTYRIEMPLPGGVTINMPSVEVEHDVDNPFWKPAFGRARDAVSDVRTAEFVLYQADEHLREAEKRGEDTSVAQAAYEEAERKVAEAQERAKGVRGTTQPATDRVSLGNVSAKLDLHRNEIEVNVEERNPIEEYRRAYELVRAILEPLQRVGLTGLVEPIHDFVLYHTAFACSSLEELGTIGRVCQDAKIPRLQVYPSW